MQNNSSIESLSEELNKTLSEMMHNISEIKEKYENDDFISDIEFFIETYNFYKSDEKLITQECNLPSTNQIAFKKQEELCIPNPQNLPTLPETKKKNKKIEDAETAIESYGRTINRIIKETKLKIRISKKRLETFFEENSLEDIKKKTLMKIFASLHSKNRAIIKKAKNSLEGKNGYVTLKVLMKLTFDEMYDYYKEDCKLIYYKRHLIILSGKFDTLNDMMRKKYKKLRRLNLKTIKPRQNNNANANEEPMEIEKEVFAILID